MMPGRRFTTTFLMLTALGLLSGCVNGPRGLLGRHKSGSQNGCGDPGCTDPACFTGVDDLTGPYSVSALANGSSISGHGVAGPPIIMDAGSCGSCGTDSCGGGCGEGAVGGAHFVQHAAPVSGPVSCGNCGSGGCQGGCLNGLARHGKRRPVRQVNFRPPSRLPRELDKTTLPRHVIEPPDILLIEAVDHLRTEHSRLQAGDSLVLQVGQTVPVDPTEGSVDQIFKVINGAYAVGVDGYLDLGPEYGKVLVEGLTLAEARTRMDQHLRRTLKSPKLYLAFTNTRTRQLISGQHLVRPDGTVSLGIYGSVYVSGMTIDEARARIESHLSPQIHRPQVSVDILAYNSKYYYVVADGGGAGEQVIKLPCTGNETVLDAIANIRGLPTVASKGEIWIARPAPAGTGADQRLPVNWNAIVRGGSTDTNYQVLPGDRIYLKADSLIVLDTAVAKLTAPLERIFGFLILGNGTVRALQSGRNSQFGGGGGIGF